MTQIFLYIIVFLTGLIIGSFLNCVIFRLAREESFVGGHSKCINCDHKLGWKDLVPIFSFIYLRGKCRYCNERISWQYPLVEITTGILFILIFWKLGFSLIFLFEAWDLLKLVYFWTLASLFIIIFVYDLKYYLIPDGAVFAGMGLAFLYNLFFFWNFACPAGNLFSCGSNWNLTIIYNLGFSMIPALFFLVLFLISRGEWIGFGDIKLAVFMGLFLGWTNVIIALFLGVLLGAIMGLGLMIMKKKKISSEIPFGPFLVTGTFAALFCGDQIMNWYINLLI